MSLHVVHGESRNRTAAEGLAAHLRTVVDDGTLYLGYPVLTTSDQRVEVDALLVSQAHGLVAFLLADGLPSSLEAWHEITSQQDTLFAVLEGNLRRHESLRAGRQLAVNLNTATVFAFPVADGPEPADGSFYGSMAEVAEWIGGLSGIGRSLEHNLNAALQRVTTIKPPKKRSSVVSATSRGAVLKEIERGIANLDLASSF